MPRRIDRKVTKEIADGLIAYLDDLGRRDHDARATFDAAVDQLVSDLKQDAALRERVNAMRDRFLAAPEVNAYFQSLWLGLRARLDQELEQPNSRLRQALSGILRAIGSAIAEDPALQARMDNRVDEGIQTLIVPWRKEIGRFVSDVVRSWAASTIVDRVELAVGKDLQYIRLNGTLVGAAVGCAIFALTQLLR